MNYLVRQTLDYSIVVEANDEATAIEEAMKIPLDEWDDGDTDIDAEPEMNYLKRILPGVELE